MYVEKNFVLARFEKHVCTLQNLVNANVERRVTVTDGIAKIGELLSSDRSFNKLDYSVKI